MTEDQAKALIENTRRMGDLLELILQELRQNPMRPKIGVVEGGTGPVMTVDDQPLRG